MSKNLASAVFRTRDLSTRAGLYSDQTPTRLFSSTSSRRRHPLSAEHPAGGGHLRAQLHLNEGAGGHQGPVRGQGEQKRWVLESEFNSRLCFVTDFVCFSQLLPQAAQLR